MAQNGGPSADRITLSQPRPDGMRNGNYYTETPLRPVKNEKKEEKPGKNVDFPSPVATGRAQLAPVHAAHRISPAPALPRAARDRCCVTFTKEKHADEGPGATDSILCPECGKCKCLACRQPRSLPSRWICNSRYECSAEACLDTVTCMCCVKGVFYHCTKDYDMDDDVSCADRPCSCAGDRRCVRWSCMGMLSLAMPCLLCYWPLRGCMAACEAGYARYNRRGCECAGKCCKLELTSRMSNKRLLENSC